MESIKKPNKGIWAFWLICTYFCLRKQPTETIHHQSKPNYTKENQHLPLVSNGAELETINAHKFSHTHMQRYVRNMPFFLLSVRVLLNCMCVPHCYGAVHSTSTRDTCGFLLHQMHANRVILLRSWANTKTPIWNWCVILRHTWTLHLLHATYLRLAAAFGLVLSLWICFCDLICRRWRHCMVFKVNVTK